MIVSTEFNKIDSKLNLVGLKVAILTAGPSSGEKGGAERFYDGLFQGFKAIGCDPTLIFVQVDEPNFQTIVSNYRKFRDLDLREFDLVVSTKVPTYAVTHPNHVLYLVHTVRVFDDIFDQNFSLKNQELYSQRAKLHAIDFEAMSNAKARFADRKSVV